MSHMAASVKKSRWIVESVTETAKQRPKSEAKVIDGACVDEGKEVAGTIILKYTQMHTIPYFSSEEANRRCPETLT